MEGIGGSNLKLTRYDVRCKNPVCSECAFAAYEHVVKQLNGTSSRLKVSERPRGAGREVRTVLQLLL